MADSTKDVSKARQEAVSEAVSDLKKVGMSSRQIAKEVGVDEKTVRNLSETGQIPHHTAPEMDDEDPQSDEIKSMPIPQPPQPTEAEKAAAITLAKAKR